MTDGFRCDNKKVISRHHCSLQFTNEHWKISFPMTNRHINIDDVSIFEKKNSEWHSFSLKWPSMGQKSTDFNLTALNKEEILKWNVTIFDPSFMDVILLIYSHCPKFIFSFSKIEILWHQRQSNISIYLHSILQKFPCPCTKDQYFSTHVKLYFTVIKIV